jgi:hypothetical protein
VVAEEVGAQAQKQMHLREQQELEQAEQHFKNTQLAPDNSSL